MGRWMNRAVWGTIAVCVGAAAIVFFSPADSSKPIKIQDIQHSLARLYRQASYYGALERSAETTQTLWPVAVLPEWFDGPLPVNGMLSGIEGVTHQPGEPTRPWIDVAPPGDRAAHPPDPMAVRPDQAQFWYNPNVGVFRARVPPTLGEAQALQHYNAVNGVELEELHRDTNPARTPLAYSPGQNPADTLATLPPRPSDAHADSSSGFFASDRPASPSTAPPASPPPDSPPARTGLRERLRR
ncbi:MAG: hypothetical protein AAGG38_05030 [Planctomycetota bacterium]